MAKKKKGYGKKSKNSNITIQSLDIPAKNASNQKTIRSMKTFNKKSKHVPSKILEGSYSERTGVGVQTGGAYNPYFKYDIKAHEVSDGDIKRMAKLANDRLYKLEKSGMSEYSREYQIVEHYAVGEPNGKGSIYNVSDDFERIRFTSSTKGMNSNERKYYIDTLRNFLRAETSTITGTRNALNQAYNTFMKNSITKNIPDMTVDQYKRLWKTYRESVMPDRMAHEGYNAFIEMVRTTNLYQLDDEQMFQAINYINEADAVTVAGIVGGAIDEFDFLHN